MDANRNSSTSTSTNYSKHQTVVNVTTTTTTVTPSSKSQRRSGGGGGALLPKVDQTRRLVTQILSKLKKRKKPPSVFTILPEYYKNAERSKNVNGNLVSLLGSSVGSGGMVGDGGGIAMDEHGVYSTDETCDLLIQLRDVLTVCKFSGITFGDRPLRPPNALQMIVLDVAFLLIDQNPYSPRWLYELGMTMLSAFVCFEDILKGKLLVFYGKSLLPRLMACNGMELNNAINGNLGVNRENRGRTAEHKGKNLISEHENSGHINIMIQNSSEDGYNPPPVSIEIHSPIDADPQNQSNRFQQHSQSQQQTTRYMSIKYKGDMEMEEYYADSMFTPLLYSIVQYINVNKSSLETIFHMHHTLAIMIESKPQLYHDIIEVIAFGGESSRAQAVNILFFFWGNCTGHPVIGHPLQNNEHSHQFSPHIFTERANKFTSASTKDKHATLMMSKRSSLIEMHGQLMPTENPNGCMQCFEPVIGFGLRCNGCKINLHFGCYNLADGVFLANYSLDSGVHKLSTPRFCDILPNPRRVICDDDNSNNNNSDDVLITIENQNGHKFHLINLFTLVLCMSCHEPLWGIMHQGYRCEYCNRFLHIHCLDSQKHHLQSCPLNGKMSEADALIDHDLLRKTFLQYYKPIVVSHETLPSYSVEELSVMISILEIQDSIVNNGILAGCLLVRQQSSNHPLSQQEEKLEKFELQELLTLYEEYYFTGSEHVDSTTTIGIGVGISESTISQEYWEGALGQNLSNYDSKEQQQKHHHPWILCEDEYLGHFAAFIKSGAGFDREISNHNDYLGVNSNSLATTPTSISTAADSIDEVISVESISTNEIIRWVKNNLGFQSEFASKILIQQMANLGFVERIDGHPIIFSNSKIAEFISNNNIINSRSKTDCTFPFPFGIEYSPNVETLISAIVSCLKDISIAINECGLLLLTRRCWPDPFLSRYTLERLLNAIIEWICCEDDRLLVIAREYTPSGMKLPGVRDDMDDRTIPSASGSGCATSANNNGGHNKRNSTYNSSGGGAYVISRKMLKEKYILGWLFSIHQMDPELYCDMIYCQVVALEELHYFRMYEEVSDDKTQECAFEKQERILRYFIKLWSADILFSPFNKIMARWLDNMYHLVANLPAGEIFIELKSLQRVFMSKNSGSRLSMNDNFFALNFDNSIIDIDDPMKALIELLQKGDTTSVSRGLQWMELLVRGGVGIPGSVYSEFLPLLANVSPKLEQYSAFMQIVWYQVIGVFGHLLKRQDILELITNINLAAMDMIHDFDSIGSDFDIANARFFVKISMALTLHSFACPLDFISSLGIVNGVPSRTTSLNPSSSKSTKRSSILPDPTPGSHLTADSPIIKCLFNYAKFERLGIEGDLTKTFWGLCDKSSLIYNKNEFLISCISELLPSVWETVSPIHDADSDTTMRLLMRLIWADTHSFRAFVSKTFEHEDWEIRFKGLDHLYGIFSKLDEKYQVQWAGIFAHLGPIFSYFVASLWDKEEYVRTKAISYIRSMQQFNVRLAIKCWEEYFETANTREQTLLVKLMIRFNAQFPDLQVINWNLLFKALSQEIEESVSAADILESYMRPDSILVIGLKQLHDETTNPGQKVAEEENLKVLLITLALQMVGNGTEITKSTAIELKRITMSCLGFTNCRVETNNGHLEINHGELQYTADDFSQNMMMIACLSNLKKILDTPINFKPEPDVAEETSRSISSSSFDEQSEDLVGAFFVDVVLKMFNSSIDISTLSHLMLKNWIELMLIIVYKHKIEDRRNKELEEKIVNAMRRISELLIKDVSDENKLLIIQLSACLLKRSPTLTVNILGKQIIIIGKLMTNLKCDTSIQLVNNACDFLRTAFLKFALNGLFVLIFKNQEVANDNHTELDMFRVLRKVIGNEIIPAEDENQSPTFLREQPIRDVMNQVFKFNVRKIVSTILCNLNKYVQLVYSEPYDEQLIVDVGVFFNKLAKHTSEWKRGDWDINPILQMAATIFKANSTYAKLLIPSIKSLLRHAIQKCTISVESCLKLLASYTSSSINSNHGNLFGEIVIEELRYSFRGSKSRLNRDTMILLLQNRHPYFVNVAENLFDECVSLLENPTSTKQYSKKEFKVGVCIGQLVVAMCNQKYDLLTKIFLWQKPTEPKRTIRLLDWVLLCMSKSEATSSGLITTIFDFQDNIADLLIHALRQPFNEILGAELNYLYTPSGELAYQAFLLIKIWTVLCGHATKLSSADDGRNGSSNNNGGPRAYRRLAVSLAMAERRFWNSIWPSMRQQLVSSIIDKDVQSNIVPYWEMFMDLITFLHLCGSDIVMLHSQEWCTLLDSLVTRDTSDIPEFQLKIRQARAIFNDPPLKMSEDMLSTQLFMEMREAMRLYFEVHANAAMRFF
ncbi:2892_t:CDS:10 [Ambispora gerdemannii]|uniref:2892_t:CDS:1 n=1 Tax=Ambispora gerdemannii TaxID=144530 RepID=A0A9N8VLU2_9GLOM|nr:2892_t:CDS:10 [Ambispora gerdemannii]